KTSLKRNEPQPDTLGRAPCEIPYSTLVCLRTAGDHAVQRTLFLAAWFFWNRQDFTDLARNRAWHEWLFDQTVALLGDMAAQVYILRMARHVHHLYPWTQQLQVLGQLLSGLF